MTDLTSRKSNDEWMTNAITGFAVVVGACALRGPFTLPDARTAQHGIGVHNIDPDSRWRALKRETPREMQFGGFGGAVGGRARGGDQCILRADKDDRTAQTLRLEELHALAAH